MWNRVVYKKLTDVSTEQTASIFMHPENGGSLFHRNTGMFLPADSTTSLKTLIFFYQ